MTIATLGFSVFAFLTILLTAAQANGIPQSHANPATLSPSTETATNDQAWIAVFEWQGVQLREDLSVEERPNGFFVPLEETLDGLEYRYSYDAKLAQLRGKGLEGVLKQDRSILIDFRSSNFVLNGVRVSFPSDEVFYQDDVLFVSTRLISRIWPVTLTFDPRSQILRVVGHETLPVEARLAREEKRKRLQKRNKSIAELALRETPYQQFQAPSADVTIGAGKNSDGSLAQFSIIAAGDLAYNSLDTSLTGDSREGLTDLRFTLGRESNEGGVFGFSDLRVAKVGDVLLPSIGLISNPRYERGIQISTFPLSYANELGQITIDGRGPPNSEVELYRDRELIGFQVIASDGRFAFVNIPLFLGKNEFTTFVYHPDGQVDETSHEYRVDDFMLPKGTTAFHLFATETGFSTGHFLGIRKQTEPIEREVSLLAAAEHALSPLLSARAFVARSPDRQSLIDPNSSRSFLSFRPLFPPGFDATLSRAESTFMNTYFGGGAKFAWAKTYWKADFAQDQENGKAYELSALSGLGQTTFSLAQAEFRNFLSPVSSFQGDLLSRRQRARVITNQSWTKNFITDSDLTLERREGALGTAEDRMLWRISQRIERVRLTHFLDQNWTTSIPGPAQGAGENTSASNRIGDLEGYRRWGSIDTTLGLTYDLNNDQRVTALRALLGYDRSGNARFDFAWQKQLQSRVDTYAAQVSQKFKALRTGLQLRWDRVSDFSAFATLTFGVAQDPTSGDFFTSGESLATTGMLIPEIVFERGNPENTQMIREPLPEAEVLVFGRVRRAETDRVGERVLRGLSPNERADISVGLYSLADPFWRPTEKGYAILPRRGVIMKTPFTIIETGEIDLPVKVDGETAAGVKFILLDENRNIIARQRSFFDGQLYFNALVPGAYTLKLDTEQNRKWRNLKEFEKALEFKYDQLTIFDLELNLERQLESGDEAKTNPN